MKLNQWETNSNEQLLAFLVGDYYGEKPENQIDAIKRSKEERAAFLVDKLKLTSELNVLEIGSGMGYTSKHIAKQVKQLHCCDISSSFLKQALEECRDIPNIFFHKIDKTGKLPGEDHSLDVIYSDAVFIHLNLYDIFWYFSEFKRLAKDGGVVWFNIMDPAVKPMSKLIEMAEYYKADRSTLKNLLCWNSLEAVVHTASHFGFALQSKELDINLDLKFIKTALE